MSFKDLSLYRSAIEDAITKFPNYQDHKIKKLPDNRYNFSVTVKGVQHPAMLNIIYLLDGNTTLNPLVGKNQTLSDEIAQHIAQSCTLPVIESKRFYIKNMSDEDFASLIEYVGLESQLILTAPINVQNGKKYVVSWNEGGHIYINRYNSKAFSVQGNSNHVKEKILEILTQVLPYKTVIDAQMESLEVNITSDQVLTEIETEMPNAFQKMGDTLLAVISPSFALRSLNIELADYSAFAFPILKGVEGTLRIAFARFGIVVGDTVGSIFNKLPNGLFELPATHSSQIPDASIVRLINELYNLYYTERNTSFHTNIAVQTSRIMEDKAEALNIINDAIKGIEDLFSKI